MKSSKELLKNGENEAADPEYENFEGEFEKLSGICLRLYKEKQMKRRINTLIERKGLKDYQSFLELLRSDPDEMAAFIDYITINVSEFFRTPDQWGIFEAEALPLLPGTAEGSLKIWSTACATGEEAYSLAMSLSNVPGNPLFHIIATDIDDKVLSAAKRGFYTDNVMEKLAEERIQRFFLKENGGFRVSDELKAHIEFRKMDILKDDYPKDCDLIVCRNVLIYFTEEAKNMIYERFYDSLKPGGYLFTGSTEQIIYYKKLGFKKIKNFLYQKPASISSKCNC